MASPDAAGGTQAESLVATGFYRVMRLSGDDTLGSFVFLHGDETLGTERGPTGHPDPLVRGVFGASGVLQLFPAERSRLAGTFQCARCASHQRKGRVEVQRDLEADGTLAVRILDAGGADLERATLVYAGRTEAEVSGRGYVSRMPSSTQYVAHRGSAFIAHMNPQGIYPANTIEAFEAALRAGYQGFELDVHVARDGVVVVSHDEDLSVSTSCSGNVSQRTGGELSRCEVSRSALVPECTVAADESRISGRLPMLEQVLDRYLPDPRLQVLVVDVKPGDESKQAEVLSLAVAGVERNLATKLLFLTRSDSLIRDMKERGAGRPGYALEGSTGWEPLNDQNQRRFLDNSVHDALSVSLGLGLGLNGFGHGVMPTLRAVWNVFGGIGGMAMHADMDIAYLGWSEQNVESYVRLLQKAHEQRLRVVGWTVNTREKVALTRATTPDLDYCLSDLPYGEIARLQLLDMNVAVAGGV